MSARQLVLRRWNPARQMKVGKVSVFIGRRGSGKSHLMMDIARVYRTIESVVVFSESEDGNEAWGAHVPQSFIYKLYTPEAMRKIYDRQCSKVRRAKRDPSFHASKVLVVLEDQMFATSIGRDQMLRQVLMNGRHYGITLLITMQYTKGLPPDMREQVDYAFCLQQKNAIMRKRLYDDWFGIFPDFSIFEQTFQQCTDNYGVLVMDQTCRTSKLQDNVFCFTASKEIPPYKLGSPQLWLYHHMHYRGERDPDDTAQIEEAAANRKSKGTRVKVVKRS